MVEPLYRRSIKSDLPAIIDLLTRSKLLLDGVEEIADDFLLAFRDEDLVGCAALERYGSDALLRSVAVRDEERSTGLGQEIVRQLLDQAYADGIKNVALLTTTAERFFPRFGFRRINRDDAPKGVQSSIEFLSACPQSATVMLVALSRPPILVRKVTEDDLAAITRIYNQGIEDRATFESETRTIDERREWMRSHSDRHPITVAVQGGEVAGWADLHPFNTRQSYRFVADLSIYVERERRNAGLGSVLMRDLIERGRALGYHKLVLTTFPHSEAAIRLYEKCGFRTVGDYREQGLVDGRWTDTRIMELLLEGGECR